MFNPDSFYDNIAAKMQRQMNGIKREENTFWQHIGHYINHENIYIGKMYDEILGNIDRMLSGAKKHGFEQNKKTDFEKLVEGGKSE